MVVLDEEGAEQGNIQQRQVREHGGESGHRDGARTVSSLEDDGLLGRSALLAPTDVSAEAFRGSVRSEMKSDDEKQRGGTTLVVQGTPRKGKGVVAGHHPQDLRSRASR